MLQKSSIVRTAEFFFINPTKKHYLMDISRNVGLAHTSIKKNLKDLVKLGLIVESADQKGGRLFPTYKANLENKQYHKDKLIYNFSSILNSGLVGYLEDKLMPKSIILFGSYSRGEDVEDSDIDIFVETKKEDLNLKMFEKKVHRKIELHFKENFTLYPPELKNNIINGFVLSGFLEGYK